MRKIAGFGALPKAPVVTVTTQASPPQAAVRHEGGKGLARERWTPPIDGLPAVQRAVVKNARSMAEAESNDSCVPFDQAEAIEQMFGPDPVRDETDAQVAALFGPFPEAAAAALIGGPGSILGRAGDPEEPPPDFEPGIGLTEAEIRKALPGVRVRRVSAGEPVEKRAQSPSPVSPSGPAAVVYPRPEMTAEESFGIMFGPEAVSEGNSVASLSVAPLAPVAPLTRKRAPRTKPSAAKAPEGSTTEVKPTREQRVATALGVDLAAACPVCEAVDPCSCLEEERTFARRVRRGFAGILRCPTATCGAPLSVLYLPRVGAPPRHRHLVHYTAVHLCAQCQGDGIAAILGGP